ncbi:hypothetical protein C0J52_12830 [Blattella germanica]|nr:hypothetical protein C0J52_12830 [Blattella germanica]
MWALALLVSLVGAVNAAPKADDYVNIDGLGYYKAYTYKTSWGEAMTTCYFDGGHLAIVNSEEESVALKNLMAENEIPYYAYLGFSDLFQPGDLTTVTGVPIKHTGYSRWEGGLRQYTGWRCGALTSTGEITTRACNENLPYICEKDIVGDYLLVPGIGKYTLHEEKVTWGVALDKCHLEGATLAVFNSDEEAAAVVDAFLANRQDLVHVGVHDRYREAFYTTVDGSYTKDAGYDKWTTNEPVKDYSRNNVAVDNAGLYHLQNATVLLPYLCEKHID